MKICILSNKSLDDLEKLVTDLFVDVPNKDVEIPDLGIPVPILAENLG